MKQNEDFLHKNKSDPKHILERERELGRKNRRVVKEGNKKTEPHRMKNTDTIGK
jgi:hypothetical protein